MGHWTAEMFVDHPEVFETSMRQRLEGADEEVKQLVELVDDHGINPETILDVACGIGRHAVELGKTDIDVHGIDISPEYIEVARERARDTNVADQVTFEVGDMRDLTGVGGEYNVVINMWTAFGYFDDDVNEAVAREFRKRIADNGALVMEVVNKEALMANYDDSTAMVGDEILHAERREYLPETGRMETTLTLFRVLDDGYKLIGEVSWDVRLYAPAELRQLLYRAGFSTVHLYGGLAGEQLERESNRLVIVAEP